MNWSDVINIIWYLVRIVIDQDYHISLMWIIGDIVSIFYDHIISDCLNNIFKRYSHPTRSLLNECVFVVISHKERICMYHSMIYISNVSFAIKKTTYHGCGRGNELDKWVITLPLQGYFLYILSIWSRYVRSFPYLWEWIGREWVWWYVVLYIMQIGIFGCTRGA
jgi:hypothetical protein